MDKVQKLSSNECYTPSSEPFRMYDASSLQHRNEPDFEVETLCGKREKSKPEEAGGLAR
jgi:hypothetical protein